MSIGKEFERRFKEQFKEQFGNKGVIIRNYDTTNGFAGIRNICDFFVFLKNAYAVELKTVKGSSLPFRNITQWNDLMLVSESEAYIEGIVIVFFYEKHTVRAYSIKMLQILQEYGKKSVRYDDALGWEVTGEYKKLWANWDWKSLFDTIENWSYYEGKQDYL